MQPMFWMNRMNVQKLKGKRWRMECHYLVDLFFNVSCFPGKFQIKIFSFAVKSVESASLRDFKSSAFAT